MHSSTLKVASTHALAATPPGQQARALQMRKSLQICSMAEPVLSLCSLPTWAASAGGPGQMSKSDQIHSVQIAECL